MKINISGLSEGIHQYDLSITAVELGLEPHFIGNVAANITLEKSIHQILATVNASVKGVFICDRCADEFTDDIETTFRSVYSWEQGEDSVDSIASIENDDFLILRKEDNVIDVSSSLKEYITLAVPVKLLCANNCTIPVHIESEDVGLDPRWEKLEILKKTKKN